MKNGVAAELAKLTARRDFSYTWAVVFDTTWRPVMPPGGERWDYEPFTIRAEADRRMRDPRSERFAEPELWERGEGGWDRVALARRPTAPACARSPGSYRCAASGGRASRQSGG